MSGKKQHFIPQFLQRGFSSRSNGENFHTWVFRKNRNPYETNVKNSGAERLFYTEKNDRTLDDKITGLENAFGQMISNIRISDSISDYQEAEFSELISHLESRTRYLRESFRQYNDYIINQVINFIEDENKFLNYLLTRFKKDPTFIIEKLKESGIPEEYFNLFINDEFIKTIYNQTTFKRVINDFKNQLSGSLINIIKHSHISALNSTNTILSEKSSIYSKLNYTLVKTDGINLPLGDTAVIFQVKETNKFKPFFEKGDSLHAVILPISQNRILLGSVDKNYSLNITSLPQNIASCSLEYFICSKNSEYNLKLRHFIGDSAYLLSEEQLDRIVGEIFNI